MHFQVLKRLASNPSHLQFPSESEDNPQKQEVYWDGHRELPKDIEGEIEEDDNEDHPDFMTTTHKTTIVI